MHALRYLLRGTGRRRAADYIPIVEAERDAAIAKAAALADRLAHADSLLIELCCQHDQLQRRYEQAIADRNLLAEGHSYVVEENNQLAHRLIAANAELANLKPISVTAPADWPDDHDTEELHLPRLWTALDSPTAA